MLFAERLEHYKKKTDYFIADIFRNENPYYCESKHDLTWSEAKRWLTRGTNDEKIYKVQIIVEDWDQEGQEDEVDDLFAFVCETPEKEACQWHTTIEGLLAGNIGEPVRWRVKK